MLLEAVTTATAATAADTRLSALPALSAPERHQVLAEWNDPLHSLHALQISAAGDLLHAGIALYSGQQSQDLDCALVGHR